MRHLDEDALGRESMAVSQTIGIRLARDGRVLGQSLAGGGWDGADRREKTFLPPLKMPT
ncbi:MAG: hypothetical protein PVF85_13150 [Anaerolineales bacterium]